MSVHARHVARHVVFVVLTVLTVAVFAVMFVPDDPPPLPAPAWWNPTTTTR